jgi:AhpD family alkylhydroperoxidase
VTTFQSQEKAEIMNPQRIDYGKAAPDALKAMLTTNACLDKSTIPQNLRRLIELRVSQINHCSYCIWLHAKQARDLGENEERISSVANWHTADCYTLAETAAFAWAEAVTRIAEGTPSDELYDAIREHFDDRQVVELTTAVANMNALNRLAISFQHEAPAG